MSVQTEFMNSMTNLTKFKQSTFLLFVQFVLTADVVLVDFVLLHEHLLEFVDEVSMHDYFLNIFFVTFPAFLPGRFWMLTEQANFYFKVLASQLICSSASLFGTMKVSNPTIFVMFLLLDFSATS